MAHSFTLGDLQLFPLHFCRRSDSTPKLLEVFLNILGFQLQVFADVVHVRFKIVDGERQSTDMRYEVVRMPFVEFAGASLAKCLE